MTFKIYQMMLMEIVMDQDVQFLEVRVKLRPVADTTTEAKLRKQGTKIRIDEI